MEKKDLQETTMGHSVAMEMTLLGNIMQNMDLISPYRTVLSERDFEDEICRFTFLFLVEYYRRYGCLLEETKINLLAAECYERDSKIQKWVPLKNFYKQIICSFKDLGVPNQPIENLSFCAVKRNSTIRELEKMGFSMDKLLENKNLNDITADDVIDTVQEKLDSLTGNVSLRHSESLGDNLAEIARVFLSVPEVGLKTPFEFINKHMHGFCKNDVTMIGGVTNSGKGRCLINILAFLICVDHQKIYLMSNEMTLDDYFKALICTIVNSPPIQELHGKRLQITQSDIVQNRFRDGNGNIIERMDGEEAKAFEERLIQQSAEYRDYSYVIQWFQDNYSDSFHFINVADDYSADRLKAEIRKAERKGCSVVAYDTLKGYQSTEWGDLVQAATSFSEAIKFSPNGTHGILTFQLTDDVNRISPESLGSGNISTGKNIMHVADNMIMFQQMRPELKGYYRIWKDGMNYPIPNDVNIATFKIIKNRRGNGKDVLYGVQNNLDLNCWGYLSELHSVGSKAS